MLNKLALPVAYCVPNKVDALTQVTEIPTSDGFAFVALLHVHLAPFSGLPSWSLTFYYLGRAVSVSRVVGPASVLPEDMAAQGGGTRELTTLTPRGRRLGVGPQGSPGTRPSGGKAQSEA